MKGDLLIDRILQNALDHLVISYWYFNGTYHFGKYNLINKTDYEINIKNIEIIKLNLEGMKKCRE